MIDQLLYEKYAGRRGDPTRRFGEALAAFVAQEQRDHAALETPLFQRFFVAMIISHLIAIVLAFGAVLMLVYGRALFA